MKVAFDVSTAAFEKKTGTGVYVEELALAYQKIFSEEDEIAHCYRLSRRFRGRKYLLPLSGKTKKMTILDPWTAYRGLNFDVFHGLNARLPMLLGRCKTVATIHDLFSILGEFSEARFLKDQTAKIKSTIDRADQIVVPAGYTRDKILSHFGLKKEMISVVSLGVRKAYLKDRSRESSRKNLKDVFHIENSFLLFVGTLEKRKNLVGLVRTFIELSKTEKNLPDLVLVGHEGFGYEQIHSEIKKSGLENKIKILGFVQEELLAQLYTACEAFVYLSLEEGFGIPVLEAMACGAPIISSNTTSLPEVGGGFTWLVSPHEYTKASSLISEILKGSDTVKAQTAAGKAYARQQTWEKVARATRSVYEELLTRSHNPGE